MKSLPSTQQASNAGVTLSWYCSFLGLDLLGLFKILVCPLAVDNEVDISHEVATQARDPQLHHITASTYVTWGRSNLGTVRSACLLVHAWEDVLCLLVS